MMSEKYKSVRERLENRLDWLFEKIEELQQQLEQAQDKNEQLETRNRRLLEENKALREEVTLQRLRQEPVPEEAERGWGSYAEPEAPLSEEALAFFQSLPPSFTFTTFFRQADHRELSSTTAKSYLIGFLREGLLRQEGHWMEKARSFSSFSRGRWPMGRGPSGCV